MLDEWTKYGVAGIIAVVLTKMAELIVARGQHGIDREKLAWEHAEDMMARQDKRITEQDKEITELRRALAQLERECEDRLSEKDAEIATLRHEVSELRTIIEACGGNS